MVTARSGNQTAAPMLHDVVSYPDYTQANPYQRLLVRHLAPAYGHGFGTIAEALNILRSNPPDRHVIFHLHWEDRVISQLGSERAAWTAARRFVADLEAFVDEGGRLVWTIHNERPHRDRFPRVVDELRRCLVELVDMAVVHGAAAAERIASLLEIENERLFIVPHGNYLDAYDLTGACDDPIGGPAGDVRTLLLFGRIDAYKGIDRLLDALAEVATPWRLVVAGHVVDGSLAAIDRVRPAVRERIEVREGFVAAAQVPALLRAADVVVLPYERILTSGSLLLALSAARPVVAPATPTFTELVVDEREAWLFDQQSTSALSAALSKAAAADSATLGRMRREALATARRYPWGRSGRMQSAVYAQVLQTPRPRRRVAEASGADGYGHAHD